MPLSMQVNLTIVTEVFDENSSKAQSNKKIGYVIVMHGSKSYGQPTLP